MGFDQADYFLVPLLDGRFGVGQVFENRDTPDNTFYCGLTARTAALGDTIAPFRLSEIIAMVFVPPTPLLDGHWHLAGFDQIPRTLQLHDFEAIKSGAEAPPPVHEPAVIEAFLSAWHGLYPWDSFGDLFDQIKRPHLDRPATAT